MNTQDWGRGTAQGQELTHCGQWSSDAAPVTSGKGLPTRGPWAHIFRGHEIKRCLLLGRKVMTNLDSIFKSKDITLATKVRLVKAKVFPVVMYGCESWTVKKAEHPRIDAFELWCWRRLIQPVHSEGDQPWDFFGRNDAKAEAPVLWPPHVKS